MKSTYSAYLTIFIVGVIMIVKLFSRVLMFGPLTSSNCFHPQAVEVRGIHHRANYSFRTKVEFVENLWNRENFKVCSDI